MSDFLDPDALFGALETLDHSSRFVASGKASPAPLVQIEGFGMVPLPVVPQLLEPLRSAADVAPYGRGPDTLVDPDVRRCHQVEARRVRLPESFHAVLEGIVEEAASQLGVVGSADAHLYKLLIYGPGDFFVPHRDTEKEPGMFATLVVTLPSVFTGGALRVQHGSAEEVVELQAGLEGLTWVAFYADCRHEILSVLDGVRVALVYNLVKAGAPTGPATDSGVVGQLATQLQCWSDGDPVKLVYLLDHRYTPAELGWTALKGADHARAHALRAASERSGTIAHLALLSVHIEWSAEELQYRSRYGRRGRWRSRGETEDWDEVPEDLELYDLIEDRRELVHWIDADGRATDMPGLPLHDGELWRDIEELTPDSISYHEATGNEGATLTRTYRRAAVVLWPGRFSDGIVVQLGPRALISALDRIGEGRVDTLVTQLLGSQSLLVEDAVALADGLLDRGRLDSARRVLLHRSSWADELRPPLVRYLRLAPDPDARSALDRAVSTTRQWDRDPCTRLVHESLRVLEQPHVGAVAVVLQRLPGWEMAARPMARLIDVAWTWDQEPLQGALLERLRTEPVFDHGVSAALELDLEDRCPEPWRVAILAGLRARTLQAPVSPDDARRAQVQQCSCEHCRAVNAFLDDPVERVFAYGVRQDRRGHLDSQVRRESIDVDTRELKQGSPHKIVFTKNNRRYDRALSRYRGHLDALAALAGNQQEPGTR